jgi:hypothetical protein
VLGTVPGEPSRKHPLYENGERLGHWVLLPGAVRHDRDAITAWVRHACELTAVDV